MMFYYTVANVHNIQDALIEALPDHKQDIYKIFREQSRPVYVPDNKHTGKHMNDKQEY